MVRRLGHSAGKSEGNQRQSCSDLEAELDSQAVAVASWSLSMWAADFSDASTWKQSQMSLVPWVEGDSPKHEKQTNQRSEGASGVANMKTINSGRVLK